MQMELLPKQLAFIRCEKKFPAFIGGVGSGKTIAGCQRALEWIRNGDGMILSPTFPVSRDVVQRTFFDLADKQGLRYDYAKAEDRVEMLGHVLLLPKRGQPRATARSQSALGIPRRSGADVRGDVEDHPRPASRRRPEFMDHYDSRPFQLGVEVLGRQARPRVSAHPREHAGKTGHWAGVPRGIAEQLPGVFASQEIDGNFVAFEGLVYPEFSMRIHRMTCDPPTRRMRALDWGYQNPFVCLWGAVDSDGRLYIYDEHYKSHTLIREHTAAINKAPRLLRVHGR